MIFVKEASVLKEKYSSPVLYVDELEKADVLLSSGEGGGSGGSGSGGITPQQQSTLDNSIRNFKSFIGNWETEAFL